MDRLRTALIVVAAAAFVLWAGIPNAAASSTDASVTVTPERFVALLQANRLLEDRAYTVTGTVDLTGLHTVTQPLRCQSCVFEGSIKANDVVFTRLVVLNGSRIDGELDLRGARFDDGFFLGTSRSTSVQRAGVVVGPARFDLATFAGDVGLDETTFDSDATFDGVRFGGDASFADTTVRGEASFDLARFGDDAIFTGSNSDCAPAPVLPGTFVQRTVFRHARFAATADFRGRCMQGDADFRTASFQGNANFLGVTFGGQADFRTASFQGSGIFLATAFHGLALFTEAVAARALVFKGALFARRALFFGLTAGGSLSFTEAWFQRGVDLRELSATDLRFDLGDLPAVVGLRDEKEAVLGLIESSATSRGDLALANEARYRNLSLQHQGRRGIARFMDGFFYHWAAGYLVRLLNPLWPFLMLLGIGLVVRGTARIARPLTPRPCGQSLPPIAGGSSATSAPAGERSAGERSAGERSPGRGRPARRPLLRSAKVVSAYVEGLGDTVAVAFRRKPGIEIGNRDSMRCYSLATVRWGEYLAFKALIAVFLLILANSNGTLRNVIDTIRG